MVLGERKKLEKVCSFSEELRNTPTIQRLLFLLLEDTIPSGWKSKRGRICSLCWAVLLDRSPISHGLESYPATR